MSDKIKSRQSQAKRFILDKRTGEITPLKAGKPSELNKDKQYVSLDTSKYPTDYSMPQAVNESRLIKEINRTTRSAEKFKNLNNYFYQKENKGDKMSDEEYKDQVRNIHFQSKYIKRVMPLIDADPIAKKMYDDLNNAKKLSHDAYDKFFKKIADRVDPKNLMYYEENEELNDSFSSLANDLRDAMRGDAMRSDLAQGGGLGVIQQDILQTIPSLNPSVGEFDVPLSNNVSKGTPWMDGLNPNKKDIIDQGQLETNLVRNKSVSSSYKDKNEDDDDITPQDNLTQLQYNDAMKENNPTDIDERKNDKMLQKENETDYLLQDRLMKEVGDLARNKKVFEGGGTDINSSLTTNPNYYSMNQFSQASEEQQGVSMDINLGRLRKPVTDENYSFGSVNGIQLTNNQKMNRAQAIEDERSLQNHLSNAAVRLRRGNNEIDMNSNSIFDESMDRISLSEDVPYRRGGGGRDENPRNPRGGLYGIEGSITNDTSVSNPRTMSSRITSWKKTLANKKKFDKYSKNAMLNPSVTAPTIQSVRDTVIPYKQPNQYYRGNAVNLVRLGSQTSIRTDNEYAV